MTSPHFINKRPARVCFIFIFLFAVLSMIDCSRLPKHFPTDSFKARRLDARADQAMIAENYESSIDLHQRVLKLQPNDALNLYHLGYAYGQTDDVVNEIHFYRKAIDAGMTNNDELYFNLGMAYGEQEQIRQALQSFQRGIAINPTSAENHFGAGLVYENMQQYPLAESHFLTSARLDPRQIEARLHLARLYLQSGDYQKAQDQLNQALAIDPKNRSAMDLMRQLK